VKSRGKCNADVEIGHVSTATTLLGNIAHMTGSLLEWDGRAERFTNNEAANRLLSYKYRAPYKLGWGWLCKDRVIEREQRWHAIGAVR
jgi:Oxidoreductase family, C-terminal alpha/beta domain